MEQKLVACRLWLVLRSLWLVACRLLKQFVLTLCVWSDTIGDKGGALMVAANSTNINIRVDSDVKNKAQDVFSALGLDMTSAINIFLRQAIRKNGIPFELVAEKPLPKKMRQFGSMKGKIWMADDWDAPLEDSKECTK
jgi:DNA-damage-inducible protein J